MTEATMIESHTPLAVSVLIVDDNRAKLTALTAALQGMDIDIVSAASGAEALHKLLAQDFAVVLMDVNMPIMDAFETARTIRLRPRSEHLPIIFVTAEVFADDARLKGYELGAVDYVTSPVLPQILRAKVAVFADLCRMRRHLEQLVAARTAELEQRNQDLAQRAAQLEAANKELEAFTYSASHDLRAPLQTIDGFSRALLEDYGDKLDDEARDYLQRLRAASRRMSQLVDDLLKLSRLTRADMVIEPVDLGALARAVADELRAQEPAREVMFDIAADAMVLGDARLLAVLMQNLLGNAWKFTSKHPRAKIAFGIAQHDGERAGERVYYVRDDGAGFDMARVDKLFAPFQRLHAASDFAGNGVGLATVKRIVLRHGGRVWAEGAPEQGATFYFTLPAVPAGAAGST